VGSRRRKRISPRFVLVRPKEEVWVEFEGYCKTLAKHFPQEIDLLVVRRMKADIAKADLQGDD